MASHPVIQKVADILIACLVQKNSSLVQSSGHWLSLVKLQILLFYTRKHYPFSTKKVRYTTTRYSTQHCTNCQYRAKHGELPHDSRLLASHFTTIQGNMKGKEIKANLS